MYGQASMDYILGLNLQGKFVDSYLRAFKEEFVASVPNQMILKLSIFHQLQSYLSDTLATIVHFHHLYINLLQGTYFTN